MSKYVFLLILMFLPYYSFSSNNIKEFRDLSNKGPTENIICKKYGGTPVGVDKKFVKKIIKKARNINGILYHKGVVYVVYGLPETGLIFKKTSIMACKFG